MDTPRLVRTAPAGSARRRLVLGAGAVLIGILGTAGCETTNGQTTQNGTPVHETQTGQAPSDANPGGGNG